MRVFFAVFAVSILWASPMIGHAEENLLRKHESVLWNSSSHIGGLEMFVGLRGGDINDAFQQYCGAVRIESLIFEGEEFLVSDIRLKRESSSYIDEETGVEWYSEDLNYLSGNKILDYGTWPNLSASFSFTEEEWDAIALILEYNTLRRYFVKDYPYRSGPGLYIDKDNFEIIENYQLDLEADFDKYTYDGAFAKCSEVVWFIDPSIGLYLGRASTGWYQDPNDLRLHVVFVSGLELEYSMRNVVGSFIDHSGLAIFHGIVTVVFPKL